MAIISYEKKGIKIKLKEAGEEKEEIKDYKSIVNAEIEEIISAKD